MKDKWQHWQEVLEKGLVHSPTDGQRDLSRKLIRFLLSEKPRCAFLMKGYAGTGKTTMVRALLSLLPEIKQKAVLMAPTGRAAKVLCYYSGQPAYTIHKTIYRRSMGADGSVRFGLAPNNRKDVVFVVDEASMIAGRQIADDGFDTSHLLEDLLTFVYRGENCRVLFIGDEAQLPPVGLEKSPALNLELMRDHYGLTIAEHTLTEVIRQEADSGILANATHVRHLINGSSEELKLNIQFPDVEYVTGRDLPEKLEWAYQHFGVEETLVITRSNWMANEYNQLIRRRVRWLDNELEAGELMMVVKNNYFWVKELPAAAFIANGDILEIQKVKQYTERYDFRFADAEVRMLDYDVPPFEVKMLLDTITEKGPSLSRDKAKLLFHSIAEDYQDESTSKKRNEKVFKEDPFFNALQVKFAYAVTCHKSQGGQWPVVFIDIGRMQEPADLEFYRWLYTALTRATQYVFLVQFPPEMVEGEIPDWS